MELMEDGDESVIMISVSEASAIRDLAAKEFNRKLKRVKPKATRESSWAMELAEDRSAIVELGELIDKAFGSPPQVEEVD